MADSMDYKGKTVNIHGDGWIFVDGNYVYFNGRKVREGYKGYYDQNDSEIKELSGKSLEQVLRLCL
jgi:hypothetical protein